MVRILPSKIKKDNPSNAEIKVFDMFKKMNKECIVFHSLGISKHIDKVFGEIDFVVVTYDGILCLEIKGGRIERKDGIWYYIDRNGVRHENREGPFKQVINSMYSLRKYMKERVGANHPLYKCQYASGVMFPDVLFEQNDPEIIEEIVYDRKYSNNSLDEYIKNCFEYWRTTMKQKNNFEGDYLNDNQIKYAEKVLRGDFGLVPSLKSEIEDIDQKLIQLTEEQYVNLSMLSNNKRLIIKGGAGTGKTLLAVEQAKRMALKNKNVLFLFYNNLIAFNTSQIFTEKEKEHIDVFNIHKMLLKVIENYETVNNTGDNNYFTKELPDKFLEYIGFHEFQNYYDAVIIDEGQDLLKTDYLMCIDEVLKGGLENGNWVVFYDPVQNIYNERFDSGLKILKSYNPVLLELKINCRNTSEIGTYNTLLTALSPDEYLKVQGGKVTRIEYSNQKEEKTKVFNTVNDLLLKGIKPGDIVILSPYKFDNSFLQGENIFNDSCKFVDITRRKDKYNSSDHLKFSTIQSFKGLEAKIVIVTDLDKFTSKYRRLLNYTAISRARVYLYIFYSKKAREEMLRMIEQGALLMEDND